MPQMCPSASTQAVAALAVGVVGEQVEHADALQLVVVRARPREREVVLLEVGVDEPLQRARRRAGRRRAATVSGTRSQPSASRQLEGRDLALVEPAGKSHSGRSPRRACRRARVDVVVRRRHDLDEERAVRAPGHAAEQLELAVREDGRAVLVDGRHGAAASGSVSRLSWSRADVAVGVDRAAAQPARRPTGRDELGGVPMKAGDLAAGQAEPRRRRRARARRRRRSSSSSSSTRRAPRRRARCGRRPRRRRRPASRRPTRPSTGSMRLERRRAGLGRRAGRRGCRRGTRPARRPAASRSCRVTTLPACAGLQEEDALAGLADGAGGEVVDGVESKSKRPRAVLTTAPAWSGRRRCELTASTTGPPARVAGSR